MKAFFYNSFKNASFFVLIFSVSVVKFFYVLVIIMFLKYSRSPM